MRNIFRRLGFDFQLQMGEVCQKGQNIPKSGDAIVTRPVIFKTIGREKAAVLTGIHPVQLRRGKLTKPATSSSRAVHPVIMDDHQFAIGRYLDVELHRTDTQITKVPETTQGIFRRLATRTTVTQDIQGLTSLPH